MLRPRKRPLGGSLAALAAVALTLGACGDDPPQRSQPGDDGAFELTIVNSVPLSGKLRDYGPAARKAGRLAEQQIKEAIEKAGVKQSVRVLSVDSETDPEVALDSARTLVEEEDAGCIVGPWSAPETLSVARELAIPEGATLISPATTIDAVTNLEDEGLVNRTVSPDSAQGAALAALIDDDLGGAKDEVVNVGSRDDAYGENLANAFVQEWKARGGSIGERFVYDPEAKDREQTAQRLVARDPDALVIFDFPESFAKLAPALRETGKFDPESTWGADLLASTELGEELDPATINGVRGTLPGLPEDAAPTRAFDELFEDADPREVKRETFDAQTFDAVILCYLAAVAADSDRGEAIAAALPAVSSPEGESLSWERLDEAIEKLGKGGEIDYVGASGELDLDTQGDPAAGVYDVYEFGDKGLLVVDQISRDEARSGG